MELKMETGIPIIMISYSNKVENVTETIIL